MRCDTVKMKKLLPVILLIIFAAVLAACASSAALTSIAFPAYKSDNPDSGDDIGIAFMPDTVTLTQAEAIAQSLLFV